MGETEEEGADGERKTEGAGETEGEGERGKGRVGERGKGRNRQLDKPRAKWKTLKTVLSLNFAMQATGRQERFLFG